VGRVLLVDLVEKLVVEIADTRRVVRCPHCGFNSRIISEGSAAL
jgi:hypothetical protein